MQFNYIILRMTFAWFIFYGLRVCIFSGRLFQTALTNDLQTNITHALVGKLRIIFEIIEQLSEKCRKYTTIIWHCSKLFIFVFNIQNYYKQYVWKLIFLASLFRSVLWVYIYCPEYSKFSWKSSNLHKYKCPWSPDRFEFCKYFFLIWCSFRDRISRV